MLKIVKINKNAKIPQKASVGSAGYDLYACIDEKLEIHPNQIVIIPTGISMQLPKDTAGMIYTRSGLGIKFGIHVVNGVGVIDSDYRGEVMVALHNLSEKTYVVENFERIAQLVVQPVLSPEIVCVDSLDETKRGEGGFGSSGRM